MIMDVRCGFQDKQIQQQQERNLKTGLKFKSSDNL